MPILIQCTSCSRKLRVQDHLLGKYVRCPSCQTKFVAQPIPDNAPTQVTPAVDLLAPITPPPQPEVSAVPTTIQMMEVSEPASAPNPPVKPASSISQRITSSGPAPPGQAPAPSVPSPAPGPALPQLFETSPWHVLAILAALLTLAAVIGCGTGWWIGAVVESAAAAATEDSE